MDPASAPGDAGGAASRFRAVLQVQLAQLQGTLDATFSQELGLATWAAAGQAADNERLCRLAAEVDVRRLEMEVQELQEENRKLREQLLAAEAVAESLQAPPPTPVLDAAALEDLQKTVMQEARPEPRPEPTPEAEVAYPWADEDARPLLMESAEHFLLPGVGTPPRREVSPKAFHHTAAGQTCSTPTNAVVGNTAPCRNGTNGRVNNLTIKVKTDEERSPNLNTPSKIGTLAKTASQRSVKSEDERKVVLNGHQVAAQHTPSRIPKPTRTPTNKPGASYTLEDLDDQRLLKLNSNRHGSASPLPEGRSGDKERSTTPQNTRPARRGSKDDSATTARRGAGDLKTRTMYDKRTLRRLHRDLFKSAIAEWQEQRLAPSIRAKKSLACQVAVRMRPMFEREKQQGEFEAVSVNEEWGQVVVHNCLFHADLVRPFVHHLGFCFPHAFGADAQDVDVYAEYGLPLVNHALNGQLGTLFMFGQTGSGKTYTMSSIMEHASRDIFAAAGDGSPSGTAGAGNPVKLRIFEIAGKKCVDLLSKQHMELKLLDNEDGRTNIVGANEVLVRSSEEFQKSWREGLGRRATASHGRNEESSRSHCVCVLEMPPASPGSSRAGGSSSGSLILVDCAGTERRQDTDQHSAERTRESAEINASLHALKECIRCRGREHVPYRGSYLTRVLHESFTRPGSCLSAIGTIAPAALDIEHSLATLRTLQQLVSENGSSDAPSFEQKVDLDPKPLLKPSAVISAAPPRRSPPPMPAADVRPVARK
mmetsp:Transcript_64371/g.112340  ORF Transcript_64371/g.112340 Transcript_64371/m.112340 type:complete len:765 (+) Transcript_64371:19-2313(+)